MLVPAYAETLRAETLKAHQERLPSLAEAGAQLVAVLDH